MVIIDHILLPPTMTRKILTVLFLTTILMTSAIAVSIELLPQADATKSAGTPSQQYGSATKDKVCGDKLCSETGGKTKTPSVPKKEVTPSEPEVTPSVPKEVTPSEPVSEKVAPPMWQSASGTIKSIQDPGIGHETHQLAIILLPSDKVYKGLFSYDASEPIQLVALHTMNKDSFTVSYSVSYMENEMSDTVITGTLDSMLDPGIGHETHQLAIILPPSEKTYSGVLTYSASEPIQLVALHGPLAAGEDIGQAIWTPDGKTKFALTFVDDKTDMGTWAFAGNALAVHTMNENQFTVSYSVVAGQ